jgi:heterodisulfide reductase subunit D
MEKSLSSSYFAEINTLASLQFMPGEQPYIDRPAAAGARKDLLLYLGCNILRTAHLARTAVDVLHAMGFDFNVAGGPAHCCGIVHHRNNDPKSARAVAAKSMQHFARYGATHLLMLCPSCNEYYDEVIAKDQEIAFSYEHVTAFIARNLDRVRFTRRIERRLALHHHAGHAQSMLDWQNVRKILRAIPGIEIIDLEIEASSGRHCSPKWIADVGLPHWQATIMRQLEAAKRARVDAVVNVYHSCQREVCGHEANFPFVIVNYLTLLGEAMGIEHADLYKAWKLKADPDSIFEDVRPYVEANHLDPARVRRVLSETFAPAREAVPVSFRAAGEESRPTKG